MRSGSLAGVPVLAILLCSCIAPHSVEPKIQVFEQVKLAGDVRVTVGPRAILDNLGGRIGKFDRNIVVMDGLAFRDAAFPDGGWYLSSLIQAPERRSSIRQSLGVDYLVLIGPARLEEITDEKGDFHVLVPSGVSGTKTSTLSAVVIDLITGQEVTWIVVEASGTYRVGSYLIYIAGTDPATDSAAYRGLSEAVASTVRQHHGAGRTGIAVLAAESTADPFSAPR